MAQRTIIIGDLHGCYREMMDLLRMLDVRKNDRLIFVGDLVTKGPENRRVLDFVRNRKNCDTILGNHEYILLEHYRGRPSNLKPAHIQVIEELGSDYSSYMDWISTFPSYIDLGSYAIVHAGIRPGIPLKRQSPYDLAFLKTLGGKPGAQTGTPWFEHYRGRRRIVFGHWPFRQALTRKNVIGIDTGCVYGNMLTCLVLPAAILFQVPARRAYASRKE